MLENLTQKLGTILDGLKKKGKLSKKDIQEGLREVKLALLEADVNYRVVKSFISEIEERALGAEVMESLTPGQQVIKMVREELEKIMGEKPAKLDLGSHPSVIFLVGLQGSGKTTTAGKLAKNLSSRSPLLVACDTYRPAAIDQLEQLGKDLGYPTFADRSQEATPVEIGKKALKEAQKNGNGVLIFDTAGRLQIDEPMMEELELMKEALDPDEILLVADAMTGQEAVNIAADFDDWLGLTGIILSKMDGDAQGGAALSMTQVTGKPIKFIGVGEKMDDLEVFHPDRLAKRILGMGDVLSLIEQAESRMDKQKAQELEEKIRKETFTLADFQEQLDQVKNMGPLSKILEKLPGMSNVQVDDKNLRKVEAVINSMTVEERTKPAIINGSRKRRIAKGSGTEVKDVNRLLKRFKQAKKMMKQVGKLEKRGAKLPFDNF